MKRSVSKVWLNILWMVLAAPFVCAQTTEHAQAVQEFEALKSKLAELEKPLLAVSAEDEVNFAEFLRQPDTGLIRLLPREKYDGRLEVRGGGAYYSFTRKTHAYGYGSDIELSQKEFSVGFAGMDYGYFIPVGDLPVEAVTAEHPAVAVLLAYQPKPTEKEIRAEYYSSSQGFKLGEFTGKRRVPANVGMTYLLRSLNIDHSDVLVALRAVRQDTDGSMILLWRLVKNFPKPTAQRDNSN